MRILAVYARNKEEASRLQHVLNSLDNPPPVIVLDDDPEIRLPAIQTETDLYEGEIVVGDVLTRLLLN